MSQKKFYTKVCVWCEDTFITESKNMKYCTPNCRNQDRVRRMCREPIWVKKCFLCGRELHKKNWSTLERNAVCRPSCYVKPKSGLAVNNAEARKRGMSYGYYMMAKENGWLNKYNYGGYGHEKR